MSYQVRQTLNLISQSFSFLIGNSLGSVINRDLWEIGYKKNSAAPTPTGSFAKPPGGKAMSLGIGALGGLALLGLGFVISRRRNQ